MLFWEERFGNLLKLYSMKIPPISILTTILQVSKCPCSKHLPTLWKLLFLGKHIQRLKRCFQSKGWMWIEYFKKRNLKKVKPDDCWQSHKRNKRGTRFQASTPNFQESCRWTKHLETFEWMSHWINEWMETYEWMS